MGHRRHHAHLHQEGLAGVPQLGDLDQLLPHHVQLLEGVGLLRIADSPASTKLN